MQNSARCVLPVTSVSRWRKRRSTSQGGHGSRTLFGNLVEGDLQFVEGIGARFVDARMLAGGSDEQAREADRRATDDCASKPTRLRSRSGRRRKGAVVGSGAADDDVVAAAGAGVLPIEHEFLGAEAGLAGQIVERGGVLDQFVPEAAGWMLTSITPGSGVTLKTADARIGWRSIAFDQRPASRDAPRCLRSRRPDRDSPPGTRPAA